MKTKSKQKRQIVHQIKIKKQNSHEKGLTKIDRNYGAKYDLPANKIAAIKYRRHGQIV